MTEIAKPDVLIDTKHIFIQKGVRDGAVVDSGHFGTGYTEKGIKPGTTYTVSTYYRQSRGGMTAPYIRGRMQNTNIGALDFRGDSDTTNWPINE